MITASPGATIRAFTSPVASGLTGTIGVQITDGATTVLARRTTGIAETPAASGIYTATLTAPAEGRYVVVFDYTDGDGTHWASEDLLVTGTTTSSGLDTDAPRVPAGGRITLAQGEDYEDARAITFTDTAGQWPALTGAAVSLVLAGPTGIPHVLAGTVLDDTADLRRIAITVTADQTETFEAGTGPYALLATIDDQIISLARGKVRVITTP